MDDPIVTFLIAVDMFLIILMVAVWLSSQSQLLNAMDYRHRQHDYDSNPLKSLGSDYFHWRPPNSVILTEEKWATIEKGINQKIGIAYTNGNNDGYASAIKDIETELGDSDKIKDPFKLLGITPRATDRQLDRALETSLKRYNPANFSGCDEDFITLAELKRKQLRKAWSMIKTGYSPKSLAGGQF